MIQEDGSLKYLSFHIVGYVNLQVNHVNFIVKIVLESWKYDVLEIGFSTWVRRDFLLLDEIMFNLEMYMSKFLCSCSRYPYLKRDWEKESNLGELGLENDEGKSLVNQAPCSVLHTYLSLSHKFCSRQGEVVDLSASTLNSWTYIEIHLRIAYLLPDNDRFSCLTILKHTKHHKIFHIKNHNL